jgi:chromosome segregation ATPase
MTESKRNPEEVLEDMRNKHVLLEKLEVAAGVLAGAGTVAVGLFKINAAAAAMPLTMAVALSYFNRVRMSKMFHHQTRVEVAEVQRRLSSEIQGLKPLGSGEVGMTSTGEVENAVATLAEKIAALEAQQLGAGSAGSEQITEELVQLRNHQLDLSQSLEAVNQQMQSLSTSGTSAESGSGGGVAGVDLDSLRQEFQGLLHPVTQNLVDLESRVAASSSSNSATAASFDVEPLRTEFSQLIVPVQQQLHALEAQLSSQSAAPKDDSESLQQVNGQVSALNEKLDNVAAQLGAEIAGFQQSVQQTQERMQVVHQQVEAVHQNVSAVPEPGLSPEVVKQEVHAVMGPLREQLIALEQRLGSLPVADPHAAQLQAEQMVSLQNQLNSTNGSIEDMVSHLTEHFTTEFSKIPQMIESHVDKKVANLPQAAPAPVNTKQDALSELDSILADINL